MAGVTGRIEGTERFKAKIQKMRNSLKSDASKEIGMAGAQIIAKHAQEIVHVDTGALQRSIHAEDSNEAGVAQAVAGGDGVDYAGDEEFGNSRRPPHPYMRPAVDMSKSEARTAMRQKSYALVRKAAS